MEEEGYAAATKVLLQGARARSVFPRGTAEPLALISEVCSARH